MNNEDRITIREYVEVLMKARDREFEAYKREQDQRTVLLPFKFFSCLTHTALKDVVAQDHADFLARVQLI